MSRRSTNTAAARALEAQKQAFYGRSLARNDVELAALLDLHRSLAAVKQAIIRICGEETLLDLGEGLLELNPDGDSLQIAKKDAQTTQLPAPEGQPLCVDFLLRMKLRRKILNRLARRLMRISHAMDGNDVQPPGQPKYGDLRLQVDEASVLQYAEHWKQQEAAMRQIEMAKEARYCQDKKQDDGSKEQEGEEDKSEEKEEDKMDDKDEPESKQSQEADKTSQDEPSDGKPDKAPKSAEEEAPQTNTTLEDMDDPLEACYNVLRDYKDGYEKLLDPATGEVQYPQDQERQEDYLSIKAGIGAVQPNMTAKEKEAEFKRWRTALWGRIPDQPTFQELGMKNRVFDLEDRRKKLQEDKESDSEDEDSSSDASKSSEEDKDKMDVDKDGDDESEASEEDKEQAETDESAAVDEKASKDNDGDVEMKDEQNEKEPAKKEEEEKPKDVEGTPSKSKDGTPSKGPGNDEENDFEVEAIPVHVKPLSLLPVPSFYEQDLKRIRLIHAEMMGSSIQDDIRRRLEESTRDYNTALSRSNHYYDSLTSSKQQLTHHHNLMAQMKSEYDLQVAMAKSQFLKNRRMFDEQKLNMLLPSRSNRPRTGTRTTQAYMSRDSISNVIGDCLADIVDAVDNVGQGMARNDIFSEEFRAPPMPAFEQNLSKEVSLTSEIQTSSTKLRTSEEERHRAWKKMLKVKTEFHSQGGMPDPRYGTAITAPPLRATAPQSYPQAAARSASSSYTPSFQVRTPVPAVPNTASKYSAARVRQRIATDGTVAPVSQPKKTPEGFYQRPSGRGRKGMDWDGVRGIWVPSSRLE